MKVYLIQKTMSLGFILFVLTLSASTESFKVLVLYPIPSFSHQRPIMALTESLVQKGHEVFVVSPNAVPELKNSNYTHVDVSFSYKYFSDEKKDDVINLQQKISKWDLTAIFKPLAAMTNQQFLSEPFLQFQKKVKAEKIKFDVAIIETFFIPYACAMTRFLSGNTPIISMSTISVDWYEDDLGSIQHLSYTPSYFDSFTNKMSLWQKMENWFTFHYLLPNMKSIIMVNAAKAFFRENYGADSEALVEGCETNISLILTASNPLYYYPRLLGPNVVEVGPLHIKPPEKLPKNLEDWLDGAEKGVIYFSLGSNMKSNSLPEDVRANFLKFFKELPSGYRVLWKWEIDEKIPGQSDNILGQNWLPQQSVLAHPKVKVFITQGGLQSFHEAVHYGVPLVGIPWSADQGCNVAKMVDAEIGVRLGPQELYSYQKIKAAIEAVLYDDRYSKHMRRHSAISHDFTAQALDKAVFWIEHVARHGGASHLRPSTADTTYFQFFCLDIIAVILAISFVIMYSIYSACKLGISFLFQKSSSKIKTS